MWVVAFTKRVSGGSTTYHYRLYALDIATGQDRVPPVEIGGSVPGTARPNDGHGHVVFDPLWHLNRPGLLLLNGTIHVAFGSQGDAHLEAYHGWVFAYHAATLARVGVYCVTPDIPANQEAAGVWQSGMGLAADPQGFVYFTTGNGQFNANNPGGRDYGDSVVKLTNALAVSDYFTPSDQQNLESADLDLGSGGVLIPPDPPPTTGLPPVLVACGKDGRILLINRNNMGKFTPGGPDKLVQYPPLTMPGVWGGPAYYRSSQQQQFIYYCGDGGHLKAYLFSGSALAAATQSPNAPPGAVGVTPNVSSNQQNPGSGVVWLIARSNPLRLQAFDATNLANQLLDVNSGPWNNSKGGAFIEPTAIQGKVYCAGAELVVFGL
jgi:hypothetical protein